MSVGEAVRRRFVEPAALRLLQWRRDPLARLMAPATKLDPYPLYRELRGRGLVRSPLGAWVTADHALVASVLRDPRFSSSLEHQPGYRPPSYPPGDPRRDLPDADLLTMDPPDHTRLRRLVSPSFTSRAVARLEEWTARLVDDLVGGLEPRSGFDLIDEVAFPLPIAVICHLLGVPSEDQGDFRRWGHDIASSLEPQSDRAAERRTRASELALAGYLTELVERRRADPDGSLLSALAAEEQDGERLSHGELVATASLILVAGFETTVNLIGNGVVALLSEPGSWDRLVEDPSLVPGAIEEALRYDSPVQLTSRIATEDVEVGGSSIGKGQSIVASIGGANRDPEVFADPDRFDVERPDADRHLSFSLGIHHCLGAPLARLEARLALEALVGRFPDLALAGPPVRRRLMVLRGFEHVALKAA